MKIKSIKFSLSNILFYIGMLVSFYGLIKTWVLKSNLPVGVCPIDDNRGLYMVAIACLLLSIAVEYYEKKLNINKNNKDNI